MVLLVRFIILRCTNTEIFEIVPTVPGLAVDMEDGDGKVLEDCCRISGLFRRT